MLWPPSDQAHGGISQPQIQTPLLHAQWDESLSTARRKDVGPPLSLKWQIPLNSFNPHKDPVELITTISILQITKQTQGEAMVTELVKGMVRT